jgi:hypothetical protein
MTELTVAFHNSANEPKNLYVEITRISGKEETINTHTILNGKTGPHLENIRMSMLKHTLKKQDGMEVNWIDLAQDKVHWRAYMNTIMHRCVT